MPQRTCLGMKHQEELALAGYGTGMIWSHPNTLWQCTRFPKRRGGGRKVSCGAERPDLEREKNRKTHLVVRTAVDSRRIRQTSGVVVSQHPFTEFGG